MKSLATLLAVLAIFGLASADLYMHFPRGSNNRLKEQNTNVDNQNRLFDSQNNAKGGYICGTTQTDQGNNPCDGVQEYFEESMMRIEWTQQHSCGNNSNNFCQIVIQYACEDGDKTYNGATWVMDDETSVNEPEDMYTKCNTRIRNRGLYIADQDLDDDDEATHTRQNPNADRYGNECAEERDYYPYWHPSIWKDVAVLTNAPDVCPIYQSESFNVKPKHECECKEWPATCTTQTCWTHNNENDCKADTDCKWQEKNLSTMFSSGGHEAETKIPAPVCSTGPTDFWARDNHLGNTKSGESPYWNWQLPTAMQACGKASCANCYLRVRYNITTSDYHGLQKWQMPKVNNTEGLDHFFTVDARLNGDRSIKMDNASNYFENDPIIDMGVGRGLAIALDTAQTGRVFQDRSFRFSLKARPEEYKNKVIWNLGVRGKRGNIVQVYPAVEYDFVPNFLEINETDFIHVQWTGGNNNPNGNDGQGQAGSDRNNFLQFESVNHNYPLPIERYTIFDPKETDIIRAFATSGATETVDAQLNDASPTFDAFTAMGGKLLSLKPGTYYYGCTRNNNFTNRSQKATIVVKPVN